jgi:hypothetical protein
MRAITILGGPDDTFARVGAGDPCRRGERHPLVSDQVNAALPDFLRS